MHTARIDADILLYRSMTYAEQEINWHDNVWTLYADIDEAKKIFTGQIDKIKTNLKTDDVLCCLSDRSDNFRKRIDPTYKSIAKAHASLVALMRSSTGSRSLSLTAQA